MDQAGNQILVGAQALEFFMKTIPKPTSGFAYHLLRVCELIICSLREQILSQPQPEVHLCEPVVVTVSVFANFLRMHAYKAITKIC